MREKGMIHSDDEEEGEIIVNEEDDEAIEIANNPHFAKTTLVQPPNNNEFPHSLKKRQSQARRQKHWLLDSDRFETMMNNNA